MPPGFTRLMWAQFVSALADNALLLLCIARCESLGLTGWWIPFLKVMFTTAYVVFAPWLGVLADRWAKPDVMVLANALKVLACLGLLVGGQPVLMLAVAGVGAAIYAPAKYGWITEAVPAIRLVKANAWIELSSVGAAIGGFGIGAWLVSPTWVDGPVVHAVIASLSRLEVTVHDTAGLALDLAFVAMGLSYSVAGLVNRQLPVTDSPRNRSGSAIRSARSAFSQFQQDCQTLWRDADARTSLAVTTLFWGVGATVQLLVLAWARAHLDLSLSSAAYLQLCTALGAVIGAWLAARWVRLDQVRRLVPLGILIGLGLPLLLATQQPIWAMLLMVALGTLSGLFIVPMNAWLQNRGLRLLSSGRSIAVQNFHENASILLMLGTYAGAQAAGAGPASLIWSLGIFIAACMTFIASARPGPRAPAALPPAP